MIEINFGLHAGGKRSFKDAASVVAHLREQTQAWNEHALVKGRRNQPGYSELKALPQVWTNLEAAVNQHLTQHPDKPDRLPNIVQSNGHLSKAIETNSLPGRILQEIGREIGFEEAGGAVKFFHSPSNAPIFQQLTKAQVIGAIEFQQRMAGLSSKSIRNARDAARQMVESLGDDVTAHRAQLEAGEKLHHEKIEELTIAGDQQKNEIAEWRTATDEAIRAARDAWETKYTETYQAFTEKLRLESAVKLWRDCADIHKKAAGRWQWGSLLVAFLGLVIAAVLAKFSLAFAEGLFSNALTEGSPAPTTAGLRPTWQYELIFASATTLLYLTVFFWIMRIVVRIYMTEHHLAIDATSRSSMAETYLALTKEAATDQDRAIVLASLFRPIVDGIVKDDGLPAITPAAILASLVGGKQQ